MTADPEHVEPFHWFGPATCAALYALMDAGPCARIEIRGHGEHMTLTVIRADGTAEQALNESHPCPPFCP
jgi:hypothetical protein